jgi:hypothetical protein
MERPHSPEVEFSAADEPTFSSEPNPSMLRLWTKYRFPRGGAPFAGSPAENRLVDACKRYAQYILNPDSFGKQRTRNPITGQNVPVVSEEDYFASRRVKDSSSDSARRQLHNEIALMVVGKQRSGMESEMAEHIANFAVDVHGAYAEAEA